MTTLVACLFWAVISMGVCAAIAHAKNREIKDALLLGGFLGVIGVIIVACWRSNPVGVAVRGWYPDPVEHDASRYWNGREWTGFRRDDVPPMPSGYEPKGELR